MKSAKGTSLRNLEPGGQCAVGPTFLEGGSATAEKRQDGIPQRRVAGGSLGGKTPEGKADGR